MNGTAIQWVMGTLAGLALIGLGYAITVWQIGVGRDCCPHDVEAR